MNRFFVLLVVLLSACSMSHFSHEGDAAVDDAQVVDGATSDGGSDTILTVVDGGSDVTPVDPDVVPDSPDDAIVVDAAPEATSSGDAVTDAATADAGSDAGADTWTNPCSGGYQWCGGTCVWPMMTASMCGTSCSFQMCDSATQICGTNQQGSVGCCSQIGVFPWSNVTGPPANHCPPGVCPGGTCYSASGPDFDHAYVFCCPST